MMMGGVATIKHKRKCKMAKISNGNCCGFKQKQQLNWQNGKEISNSNWQ